MRLFFFFFSCPTPPPPPPPPNTHTPTPTHQYFTKLPNYPSHCAWLRINQNVITQLTLYQGHIFRPVQIENICRHQNKCDLETEILSGIGRKHCGKRRNADYHHFLLFPQCFQKAFFSGSLKVRIVW